MSRSLSGCRRCQQARRFASFCFAAFAVALVLSASDPVFDAWQQGVLLLCGLLAALAFFRHPITRLSTALASKLQGRGWRHD